MAAPTWACADAWDGLLLGTRPGQRVPCRDHLEPNWGLERRKLLDPGVWHGRVEQYLLWKLQEISELRVGSRTQSPEEELGGRKGRDGSGFGTQHCTSWEPWDLHRSSTSSCLPPSHSRPHPYSQPLPVTVILAVCPGLTPAALKKYSGNPLLGTRNPNSHLRQHSSGLLRTRNVGLGGAGPQGEVTFCPVVTFCLGGSPESMWLKFEVT